ncbi:hypothetical protein N334_06768 [Pelecanus crispus]|uniref:Uncharacterized protein n=1 Tax=Pelecanus crispus TaxID=36300 RepID=A0A091SXN8_PELCR|nr:hypothetical protein N334_06768 [Pelecanus crispus]
MESNQAAPPLSVPIFSCIIFPFDGHLAGSLHPTNESKNCSGDLLPPCLRIGNLCWRVPFFVLSVTDVLFLRWTLPYTLIFQQMKERAIL